MFKAMEAAAASTTTASAPTMAASATNSDALSGFPEVSSTSRKSLYKALKSTLENKGLIQSQLEELRRLRDELKERNQELNAVLATKKHLILHCEADRLRLGQFQEKESSVKNQLEQRDAQAAELLKQYHDLEEQLANLSTNEATYKRRLRKLLRHNLKQKQIIANKREQCQSLEARLDALTVSNAVLTQRDNTTTEELKQTESYLSLKQMEVRDLAYRLKILDAHMKSRVNDVKEVHTHVTQLQSQRKHLLQSDRELTNALRLAKLQAAVGQREKEKLISLAMKLRKEVELAREREQMQDEIIQSQCYRQQRDDMKLTQLQQLCAVTQKRLDALKKSPLPAMRIKDPPAAFSRHPDGHRDPTMMIHEHEEPEISAVGSFVLSEYPSQTHLQDGVSQANDLEYSADYYDEDEDDPDDNDGDSSSSLNVDDLGSFNAF